MSETHLYTSPSNARRAARQAGYELDQVDIIQDGARFHYRPKVVAEAVEGAEHIEGAAEVMETVESAGITDPDDVIEVGAAQESDTVVAVVEPVSIADRIAAMDSNSIVMLLGADASDYGMCKWAEAEGMAARLAGSEGLAIGIVDPTDGAVLCSVAPEGVEAEGEQNGTEASVEGEQSGAEATVEGDQSEAEGPAEVEPAKPVEQTVTELFHQAGDRAIQLEMRSAEGLVLMIDGAVVYRENKVRKAASKADASPRAPRAAKTEPEGKYKVIVDLCCRENGASPQELHEATGWTGARWKWLLTNPKGTGLAQKYGYDIVASKDGRNVRYLLVKQEAEQVEQAEAA